MIEHFCCWTKGCQVHDIPPAFGITVSYGQEWRAIQAVWCLPPDPEARNQLLNLQRRAPGNSVEATKRNPVLRRGKKLYLVNKPSVVLAWICLWNLRSDPSIQVYLVFSTLSAVSTSMTPRHQETAVVRLPVLLSREREFDYPRSFVIPHDLEYLRLFPLSVWVALTALTFAVLHDWPRIRSHTSPTSAVECWDYMGAQSHPALLFMFKA